MPATPKPLITQAALRKFLENEAVHWGRDVRKQRLALRLTLEQVATLADTTPQTIFKVERGEIVARDHLRIAIAFALSMEPHDLFPLPDRKGILKGTAA